MIFSFIFEIPGFRSDVLILMVYNVLLQVSEMLNCFFVMVLTYRFLSIVLMYYVCFFGVEFIISLF